jgi:hypothetical protein
MAAIRHGRVMAIVAEIVIGLYIVFFALIAYHLIREWLRERRHSGKR